MANKETLVDVFRDTEDYIMQRGWELTSEKRDVNGVLPPMTLVAKSRENNITVDNKDCVLVTQDFAKLGKTCLLNMASHYSPGGGVRHGARAQEEEVCRRSNLIVGLETAPNDQLYPILDTEYIYTNDVTFFKGQDYKLCNEFMADVITIPAINLNKEKDRFVRDIDESYDSLMRAKVYAMIVAPVLQGQCENLVLSAFGCGVFKNDPKYVAGLFKKFLVDDGLRFLYKNISFAILNDGNSVANNFEIFSETFKN